MNEDQRPLVVAAGVTVQFGSRMVLASCDLTVNPGTQLALTGRSGSGKTSLLLVLAGLVPPAAGTVSWPGLHPDNRRRRAQIGMVFQAPSLVPELTALENVTLPARLHGATREQARTAAERALSLMDLGAADALPSELSGGEQQRVAIARVIAGRPRLVLADEPTGALDRRTALTVLAALRDEVRDTGGALVLVTHDAELARLLPRQARIDGVQLAEGRDRCA
jgi:ABC-type lipoprotein export system ATPase subunit